ncbi:MAG: hypothetical protein WDK96_00670 [Candidatus Paceibacterota bacterium]|jgi:hypothetical protein
MQKKPIENIVFVDGALIRQTLDDDFSVFYEYTNSPADFYDPKFYIPQNKFWFDYCFKEELDFFIKLKNTKVPKSCKNVKDVRKFLKKVLCKKGLIPNFYIRTKNIEGLKVCYVEGSIIRQYIDPQFVMGGHHYVYKYIPQNEIWLDNCLGEKDKFFTLVHEQHERDLMKKGMIYDSAHDFASAKERQTRREHGGAYPGDAKYSWVNLRGDQIIKKYLSRTKFLNNLSRDKK